MRYSGVSLYFLNISIITKKQIPFCLACKTKRVKGRDFHYFASTSQAKCHQWLVLNGVRLMVNVGVVGCGGVGGGGLWCWCWQWWWLWNRKFPVKTATNKIEFSSVQQTMDFLFLSIYLSSFYLLHLVIHFVFDSLYFSVLFFSHSSHCRAKVLIFSVSLFVSFILPSISDFIPIRA